MRPVRLPALCAITLSVVVTAACSAASDGGSSTSGGDSKTIAITAGESNCDVSTTGLTSGRHTFKVENTAAQVTEVYVYAAGDRIMGEVENVGPATTRTLIVDLPAGSYEVACKPGMVGEGNRTAIKVTGAATPGQTLTGDLRTAVTSYQRFVITEAKALTATTATFTKAVLGNDLAAAKRAYPTARLHYERIEPIAESFGDLDPLIDMRIDDATAGTPFVGFHALEQLLFQKKTLAGTRPLATALGRNVAELERLVATVRITPLTMGNGAKSLLDEVAKSKVTGEEERYSRIDLVDFAGNVEGARYVYSALRPALAKKDAALVATLDRRFTALIRLLDTHRAESGDAGYVPGSPYVSYDALSTDDVKQLAVEVDAISEPLGRISGVVTGK